MSDVTVTPAPVETQATSPAVPAGVTEATAATTAAFTQEQVNKFTGSAREEGRTSATNHLLEKFGVKTVEDLSAIISKFNQTEQEKMSDLEKANKKNAELQAQYDSVAKENNEIKMLKQFDDSVKELNLDFVNPNAKDVAFKLIDLAIVADETKGMKAAAKLLFEAHGYLFKQAVAPELDATKKTKGNSNGALTDDQIAEIRKTYKL